MKTRTVLLVEDCAITSLSIQLLLAEYHCEVICTDSCESARKLLRQHLPDLVLLNQFTTDSKDGIRLAKHISQQYQIPIIYLTGYRLKDLEQHPDFDHRHTVLLKPFGVSQLRRLIINL